MLTLSQGMKLVTTVTFERIGLTIRVKLKVPLLSLDVQNEQKYSNIFLTGLGGIGLFYWLYYQLLVLQR